ncbi:hypothetical protein EVAR_65919_1, partial [Eumeta japonica]
RTGAAYHRSTDRGRETVSGAGFRSVELFNEEQHRQRLGVRALLIIARLTVDEKTVQRRWFLSSVELFNEEQHRLETEYGRCLSSLDLPWTRKRCSGAGFRSVELFNEERHRLETWRTGAAYHRSTDRGRENGVAALVSKLGGTLRTERHRAELVRALLISLD